MFRAFLFCISLYMLCLTQASFAQENIWKTGTYQLVNDKYSTGTLTIQSVSSNEATFTLSVVGCMSDCGTLSAINHVADVEFGVLKIQGEKGKYEAKSDSDTDDASDADEAKEMESCNLEFVMDKKMISITQKTECWWFGQGMGVSGTYKLIH